MSSLYPYQEHVAELLLAGKSVVLQAPTGAGKTRAALEPLARSIQSTSLGFPTKCIYTVPMRVLANQFVERYRNRIQKQGRSETLSVGILTGEQRDDPKFEAGLTFATIDQVLSSYLLTPYSLPRRLANFNAGAVVASYLVFDEFHLFDPMSTLPTTLEMLRQLKGITPFLLMTATFSEIMLKKLADKLGAEIVPKTQAEGEALQAIPSQAKTRRYHAIDDIITADAVMSHHTGERTLVVCNTVDRARALYEDVKQQHDNTLLLHSRFLSEDRHRLEEDIRKIYAEDAPRDADQIVISTQAIEVGLDITCRVLVSELAPANAVIQRAGRCARYQGEKGDVYVYNQAYDPHKEEIIDLRHKVAPYGSSKDETIKSQFVSTWEALQDHSGDTYNFGIEQEIISRVHGPRDKEIIDGIGATKEQHRQLIYGVMRGDSTQAASLIREIASYRVTIHPEWQVVKKALEGHQKIEDFSLSREVLYGAISSLLERADVLEDGIDPLVALYEIHDARQSRDNDEANQTGYEHRFITGSKDLAGATLIVIHPALATYDSKLGLLLDRPGSWECAISQAAVGMERQGESYSYRLESYQEHVHWVWRAFEEKAWPEMKRTAAQMERVFEWPEGSLYRAAALAVLLHDVGKLSVGWQKWAHAWQEKAARNSIPDDKMAAHTDYDSTNPEHRERARGFSPHRPPHAGEGAYACLPFLAQSLEQHQALVPATFTAILRHHTPFADDSQDYRLTASAPFVVAETLLGFAGKQEPSLFAKPQAGSKADQFVMQPEEERAFLAYLLLVRTLRRADQLGTEWGMNL